MILIIDMGGQYSHLIGRRIRELGTDVRILPPSAGMDEIKKLGPEGIIISGGPKSVYAEGSFKLDRSVFEAGLPVLGICYGHQLIAHLLGGKVVPGNKEYGREILESDPSRILEGLNRQEQVWSSHGDEVMELPDGFKAVARTESCRIACFENEKRKIYGLQFHPEVYHTPCGDRILENFLKICGCKKDYSLENLDKKIVQGIKERIGGEHVIMAVSGGVDSLVASVLIKKATPNIHCVFVDNGLVRKGEPEEVSAVYRELGFENFYSVDAKDLFLEKLRGVSDPEQKRKIIGRTFVKVFEAKVEELKGRHKISFLGQGTIYPDRIESAQSSSQASVIKTHHNVGGLPEEMSLKLLEPLEDLYKDEVRKIGRRIGIDEKHLSRHPFPGPGLAVRVLGGVTPESLEIARESDAIFIEELRKAGVYDSVWQAFAAVLPAKAVGVMGDGRYFGRVVALRAVTSRDAMTADWAKIPFDVLESVSKRIVKEVKGVGRVVYDITQKPPGTIEFE